MNEGQSCTLDPKYFIQYEPRRSKSTNLRDSKKTRDNPFSSVLLNHSFDLHTRFSFTRENMKAGAAQSRNSKDQANLAQEKEFSVLHVQHGLNFDFSQCGAYFIFLSCMNFSKRTLAKTSVDKSRRRLLRAAEPRAKKDWRLYHYFGRKIARICHIFIRYFKLCTTTRMQQLVHNGVVIRTPEP